MKIRHGSEALNGQPPENTFVAYDELENRLGACSVRPFVAPELFPERPFNLLIQTEGELRALDALLGAATARALMLRRSQPGMRARVYTECHPLDEARMQALSSLGFLDDDGVMRMRRTLRRGPIIERMPQGTTLVEDGLEDELERKFFLERYNAIFCASQDAAWLEALRHRPHFRRLLLVAADGLAGELLVWEEDGMGVAGILHTTAHWRRKRVASYLMDVARQAWLRQGFTESVMDVWLRMAPALQLAAGSGYRQERVLMRYPGINL